MITSTYKRALDTWLSSIEGKRSSDASTLQLPPTMKTYLQNRLKAAFEAGWNSRETSERAEYAQAIRMSSGD